MKVLLDHNIPHKLRSALTSGSQHDVVTASFMGWGGLKNGELLAAAEASGFEIFVTADQSLPYEQHLGGLQLAVVALSTNNWPILRNHIAEILAALDLAVLGSFGIVECGVFRRKPSSDV